MHVLLSLSRVPPPVYIFTRQEAGEGVVSRGVDRVSCWLLSELSVSSRAESGFRIFSLSPHPPPPTPSSADRDKRVPSRGVYSKIFSSPFFYSNRSFGNRVRDTISFLSFFFFFPFFLSRLMGDVESRTTYCKSLARAGEVAFRRGDYKIRR